MNVRDDYKQLCEVFAKVDAAAHGIDRKPGRHGDSRSSVIGKILGIHPRSVRAQMLDRLQSWEA